VRDPARGCSWAKCGTKAPGRLPRRCSEGGATHGPGDRVPKGARDRRRRPPLPRAKRSDTPPSGLVTRVCLRAFSGYPLTRGAPCLAALGTGALPGAADYWAARACQAFSSPHSRFKIWHDPILPEQVGGSAGPLNRPTEFLSDFFERDDGAIEFTRRGAQGIIDRTANATRPRRWNPRRSTRAPPCSVLAGPPWLRHRSEIPSHLLPPLGRVCSTSVLTPVGATLASLAALRRRENAISFGGTSLGGRTTSAR
jgi:hypothetical protein